MNIMYYINALHFNHFIPKPNLFIFPPFPWLPRSTHRPYVQSLAFCPTKTSGWGQVLMNLFMNLWMPNNGCWSAQLVDFRNWFMLSQPLIVWVSAKCHEAKSARYWRPNRTEEDVNLWSWWEVQRVKIGNVRQFE